jgi:8-oxo-dGTP pyrophosphatase MutT (NUDIX family)
MTEVPLRDAATLILLKDAPGTKQVLLGRRGAGHRFMPHVLVFPGGAVDPADYAAPAATLLRFETRARLERAASPELALALAHAAARELEEEAGLSLGRPPDLGTLSYLCRAETPADREIRFNARFFLADANHAAGKLTSSAELEELAWYDLNAALPSNLARPTRAALALLKRHLAGEFPLAADAPVPVMRDRSWENE